ncbi:histidine phosphatase family protein [Arcanobacterium buesumense]|uniref:Histidine phosphatase family protein n=1 Tax=Arcanobacterium buesumense TaxID=2722751 RepID=A0A6H2EL05_9ACTO|nr:histidine phosphatase family protein [Arcanobacterium buesumense]QJC21659.1 histidine phosphatase family protein [Arcanobacterium buesumense]
MQLILVRHGQTYANERAAISTIVPGEALTETGWTQANNVVADLIQYRPDAIWRSDTLRTEQTATPLATQLAITPQVHPGLREIQAGSLEGKTSPEAMQEYISTMMAWLDGDLGLPMGSGDTGYETLQRFDEAVAEIERSGAQRPVIFAHAGILTFWAGMRVRGITEDMRHQRLLNTGIAVAEGTVAQGFDIQRWMNVYRP